MGACQDSVHYQRESSSPVAKGVLVLFFTMVLYIRRVIVLNQKSLIQFAMCPVALIYLPLTSTLMAMPNVNKNAPSHIELEQMAVDEIYLQIPATRMD